MRKHRAAAILAVLCICTALFTGCKGGDTTGVETPGKKDFPPYTVTEKTWEDKSHKGSSVSIKYPQLGGGDYSKANRIIQDAVKNYPTSVYGDNYADLVLDMNYQIALDDNSMLSIVFAGIGNVRAAAHPNNTLFTVNVNVDSGKKLSLEDSYQIDEKFIRIFKEQWRAQSNTEISDYIFTLTEEELKNQLTAADSAGSTVYSYFTDKNLGISFPVPHAIGDHVEVTIPYHEIAQNLKVKNKIFT